MKDEEKSRKIRILLVDDHEIVRCGLRRFIQPETSFEVCAEAGTSRDALAQCASRHPDVALIDLSLGDDSGLDLIKDIAVQFPEIKMLVVSRQDERLYAERVLRAGAFGFIGKDVPPEQLVEAVRCVSSGKYYASSGVIQRIMQSAQSHSARGSSVETLSDRELAVFEWIGKGAGTAEIAEATSLSIKTLLIGGDVKAVSWKEVNNRWIQNIYANGDVTFSDKDTGRMWINPPCREKNWSDAVAYCNNLTYAEYDDWRLPSVAKEGGKAELDALFRKHGDPSRSWERFAESPFAGVQAHELYWSGTPCKYGGVWVVQMFDGRLDIKDKSKRYYVWPMRGGQ